MTTGIEVFASAAPLTNDSGVERPGPGKAPTAFRIWKSGDNVTDYGVHRFTRESAAAILADQGVRGNLYSIDVDHLSHDPKAPAENHAAVGWHRLATRDSENGPELWAVDVEWTDDVKAGLEAKVPKWRYFSPAYSVDKKTGEIMGYSNLALTSSPATHCVTELATVQNLIAASRRFVTRQEAPIMQRTDLATVKACFRGVSDATDNPDFLASLTALPLDRVQQIRATFRDDYEKMTDRGRPSRRHTRSTGNGGSAQALGDYTPEEAAVLCKLRGIPEVPRPFVSYVPRSEYRAMARARGWLPR
jgi:Mu-like prophage I protein